MSSMEDIVSKSRYWLRLALCVKECIRDALRGILHNANHDTSYQQYLPSDPHLLYTFLQLHEKNINKHKVLTQEQKNRLLPSSSVEVDSLKFDCTLLKILIRDFTNLVPISGRWNNVSVQDKTLAAYVVRAIEFRNYIYHYPSISAMDEQEFNTQWTKVNSILVGLNYARNITCLQTITLDPDAASLKTAFCENLNSRCQDLEERLKQAGKCDTSYKTNLEEEINNIKENVNNLKECSGDVFCYHLQEVGKDIDKKFTKVDAALSRVKEEVENVIFEVGIMKEEIGDVNKRMLQKDTDVAEITQRLTRLETLPRNIVTNDGNTSMQTSIADLSCHSGVLSSELEENDKRLTEAMKEGERIQRVHQIQSYITNVNDIVKPGRYLVKKGSVQKSSRKGFQQREFILFTDSLLYCSEGVINQLYLIHEFPLLDMSVDVPESQELPNEFIVRSTKRSLLLNADSQKEKEDWLENTSNIGEIAPIWIPDSRVTMCQICTSAFSAFYRRHHCRGCGKVVCYDCSSYEAPLKYKDNEANRVCGICYNYLQKKCESTSYLLSLFKDKRPKDRRSGSPLPAEFATQEEEVQNQGFLRITKGYIEKRRWFVLKTCVLYEYRALSDPVASYKYPILGYHVCVSGNWDKDEFLFTLSHAGISQPMVFRAENRDEVERWFYCLGKATEQCHTPRAEKRVYTF